MPLKHRLFLFLTILAFILSAPLRASDFEWRVSLNLQAQTDPYGYRYGLINRFRMNEPDAMFIVNRVYEPADAYMIFRLAELSGHTPEYVLNVYYDRRHYGWNDIAYILGIRSDRYDFIVFRERHDMKAIYFDYNSRRKERYEEHYRPPLQRPPLPPQHHKYEQPRHKVAPVVQHPRNEEQKRPEQQREPQKQRTEPQKQERQQKRPPHNQNERSDEDKRGR